MSLSENIIIIIVPIFRVVETITWDKMPGAASTQEAMVVAIIMCRSVRDKHPRATLDDVSLNYVLISRAMWSSALRSLQGRMAQDG